MGVNGQQREAFGHRAEVTGARRGSVDTDAVRAPTIERVNGRRTSTLACALVAAGALVIAACDTGDGKQLRPYDPADYPTTTIASSVPEVAASGLDELGGFGPEVAGTGEPEATVEEFSLSAPWVDGASIERRYTCDGANISPAVSWGGVPPGTVEIAIAMVDDSSVSDDEPFVHWVIGGLDPAEIALVEGDTPPGAIQALNFFGDVGYGGPCPPPGEPGHLYRLTAYALNQQLELADGDGATEFLDTIATLTIGSADVTGLYER